MTQQTLIFLGPQGSGKGTQVELLKNFLTENDPGRPILYFEAGRFLREFAKGDGYVEKRVNEILLGGNFVPTFITTYLMSQYFVGSMTGEEHLIVDGFPRELEQAYVFDTAVKFYSRPSPTLLNITLPEEESVKRLLKRGRADDTEEGIRSRLAWNEKQVNPVIEWFRQNPRYRALDIDGNHTVEEVHQDILQQLGLAK